MFLIVANPMVEGFWLPESFTCSLQELVHFPGGVSLETLDYRAQRVIRHWPQNQMRVVRHHDPGIQPVSLSVKKLESGGNEASNVRALEQTFTTPFVQKRFQFSKIVAFDFIKQHCLGRFFTGPFCGILAGIKQLKPLGALRLVFQQHSLRQRIGETERDEAACPFPFDVRQISARMNPRAQRIGRLWFHSGSAQCKHYALRSWIFLRRKHAEKITERTTATQPRCSAELHSAVSRICNPQPAEHTRVTGKCAQPAARNPALQQIQNLRYNTTFLQTFHPRLTSPGDVTC